MATSYKPNYILSFAFFILSSSAFTIFLAKATPKTNFTVNLIHRDSPQSPLFDNSTTPYQKVHKAFHRSAERLNALFPNNRISTKANQNDSPEGGITANRGEYLMKYSLGTPEVEAWGFIDTGSDLVWLQCLPCDSCFKQKIPKYDPLDSLSHEEVRCRSQVCESATFSVSQRSCDSNRCTYMQTYEDGVSVSMGTIDTDVLTLRTVSGMKMKFSRVTFGCGHKNSGIFSPDTSGIVGLGRGPLSLVSQLGSSIEERFSYCLVPPNEYYSGKLKFGQNAIVSGPGVVSTPFESGFTWDYYYLTLEAMSVGSKRLEFIIVRDGRIMIDSGATLTYLPPEFYPTLEAEVAAVLDRRLKRAKDPTGTLQLCYETDRFGNVGAPTITAHFRGADVRLGEINTFIRVSNGVACFAFQRSYSPSAIYGNIAQINFLVGYDLQTNYVFFKPADCSKL